MNLSKCKAIFVSIGVLISSVAFSQALADQVGEQLNIQPSQWLQKISDASAQQSFHGTFVYRCDAQLVAMKIIHAADEGKGHEKLIALNGPAHEVVQKGQSITSSLFRGKRAMGVSGKKGMLSPFEQVLDTHYKIVEIGEDRIANRPTKVVEIRPNDQYRYGFLIWLDSETGIVLRSDMADESGEIIEQIMFIDVEMLAERDAESLMGESGQSMKDESAASAHEIPKSTSLKDSKWRVAKMPSGFRFSERYMREDVKGGTVSQEQLIFTDGLASVSIFIEPRHTDDEPLLGQTRIGAVNVIARVIQNHQVTVVGDVPKETIEFIASSVSFQQ